MRFASVAAVYLLALRSESAETATTLSDVENEHPDWFTEPEPYKPCPASVVFPGERHDGHRQTVTVYWRPRHLRHGFNPGF